MAASFPVLLILTDYFTGRKINQKTLLEKLPFFVLAILLGIVAIIAQKESGATDIIIFPFLQRIVFASYGFITYLFKIILPINLSAYYPYPIAEGETLPAYYYFYLSIIICCTNSYHPLFNAPLKKICFWYWLLCNNNLSCTSIVSCRRCNNG